MTTLKKLLTTFLLLTCGISYGQTNLVPNGDFEQYSGCPVGYDEIDSCLYWFNPTIGGSNGSPDYFNICSPSFDLRVPSNYYGNQPSHSGVAYSGITLYYKSIPNFREYIEVPLTIVLTANTCYHFEMYVNLANICKYTTDAIQVYFSDTAVTGIPNYYILPFVPQINNTLGNTFDTNNWTLVSGNYTAIGGESFLIIGNFKNDSITNPTIINNNSGYSYSYCYIDDVSLTVCGSNGITKNTNQININLFPNPITDKLIVNNDNDEQTVIILYDLSSRKLLEQTFTNSTIINTEQLAKGMYLYEVRNKNGIIKNGKVIKE